MTGSVIDRVPLGWLRERDIDLLVCAELHADRSLTRLIADRLALTDARFAGAWVSHSEIEGESDLVVCWETSAGRALALVENKIAAAFQPDQAARYRLRANRWATVDGVSQVSTMLIAPAAYMTRDMAGEFDVCLTYEDLHEVLRCEGDGRSIFLANALAAGVNRARNVYVANPDEQVSAAWAALWDQACKLTPPLQMARPSPKPGRSTWIYFRDAIGFGVSDRKRAVVVYKAERGQADLQFSSTLAQQLEARSADIMDDSMSVVQAAKSASIRISVQPIDFLKPFEEQLEAVGEGLQACERLRQFFIAHRSRLLPK